MFGKNKKDKFQVELESTYFEELMRKYFPNFFNYYVNDNLEDVYYEKNGRRYLKEEYGEKVDKLTEYDLTELYSKCSREQDLIVTFLNNLNNNEYTIELNKYVLNTFKDNNINSIGDLILCIENNKIFLIKGLGYRYCVDIIDTVFVQTKYFYNNEIDKIKESKKKKGFFSRLFKK